MVSTSSIFNVAEEEGRQVASPFPVSLSWMAPTDVDRSLGNGAQGLQ